MRRRKSIVMLALAASASANFTAPATFVTPQLDFDVLGDVLLAGNFGGISKLFYTGQAEMLEPPHNTTSDLIAQYSSSSQGDVFLKYDFANGLISSSCILNNSVIIVGNFTSVFNQSANGIAAVDVSSQSVVPIPSKQDTTASNINGSNVNAVWCNGSEVYFGGSFRMQNTYGVAMWNAVNQSLAQPPFGGFVQNSSVNTIVPLASSNDSIVFGGSFTGIAPMLSPNSSANSSSHLLPGTQVVSFALANATGYSSKEAQGENASALLCPMRNTGGWSAGLDSTTGYVNVTLAYTSQPYRVRLFNLADGSGTKLFRIISEPAGSFMNLTYVDEASGEQTSCAASCPLPEYDTKVRYYDFEFVNVVPTTSLRVELLDFYSDHPGLDGIQLFEQGQIAFANNALNKPRDCGSTQDADNDDTGGVIPSVSANTELEGSGWTAIEDFMSINITDKSVFNSTYARMIPALGSYADNRERHEILLYTPGCKDLRTCGQRGGVNVTVYPGFGVNQSTVLYQTNNDLKYDLIYNGTLQDGAFIQISPLTTNRVPMDLVAYKAVLNFLGKPNSFNATNLFEFKPSNFTNASLVVPVGNTSINSLGYQLGSEAKVNSLLFNGSSQLLIGGAEFPSNVSSSSTLLSLNLDGFSTQGVDGISGPVHELRNLNNTIFAVTNDGSSYIVNQTASKVDARADEIVPFKFNGSEYWAFSSSNSDKISLWDPIQRQFASRNITSRLSGHLSGRFTAENATTMYSGSLQVVEADTPGVAVLASSEPEAAPFTLQFAASVDLVKRDFTGVGSFDGSVNAGSYVNSTHSIVVGQFNATVSDNTTASNAIIIDNNNNSRPFLDNTVSLNSAASFSAALAQNGSIVLVGQFSGTVNSSKVQNVMVYNSNVSAFLSEEQPPALGDNSHNVVHSVVYKPNTTELIVGGKISTNDCHGVCVYSNKTWSGLNIGSDDDSDVCSLVFVTAETLLLAGDLGNNNQVMEYNLSSNSSKELPPLPGSASDIVVLRNSSQRSYVVAGSSGSGPFVKRYNNQTWVDLPNLPFTNGTFISSLSVVKLKQSTSNALLVSGNLNLHNGSSAASVLFDGSKWTPMYATSGESISSPAGAVNAVFAQIGSLKGGVEYAPSRVSLSNSGSPSGTPTNSPSSGPSSNCERHYMSAGHVVGIACGIGICCMIALVSLYLLAELTLTQGRTDPAYVMLAQPPPSPRKEKKDMTSD